MKVLKQMKSNPTGYSAASAQTATFLLRMCPAQSLIYCLRVGLPEHTKEAARILDNAIFHNFFTLTDLIDLLPPDETEQGDTIRGSTFLNLGRGGSGYGSSELMRKAAYMGSVAQTAMKVGELNPAAKITTENEANESTVWAAYNKALEDMQRILPDADLSHLSLTAIFTTPQEKVQHHLTQAVLAERKIEVDRACLNRSFRNEPGINDEAHMLNRAARDAIQIANNDKNASAWQTTNPAKHSTRMTNSELKYSYSRKLMLNTVGSKQWCSGCNGPVDMFGDHGLCCEPAVRGKVRGVMHATLVSGLRECIKDASAAQGPHHRTIESMGTTEPHCANYLNHNGTMVRVIAREGEEIKEVKNRLDTGFKILDDDENVTQTVLIDATITATNRASYTQRKKYSKGEFADRGAADKRKEYETSGWDVENPPSGITVIAFAVESNGCLGKEATAVIEYLANKTGGNPNKIVHNIRQTTSVHIMKGRANQTNTNVKMSYTNHPRPEPREHQLTARGPQQTARGGSQPEGRPASKGKTKRPHRRKTQQASTSSSGQTQAQVREERERREAQYQADNPTPPPTHRNQAPRTQRESPHKAGAASRAVREEDRTRASAGAPVPNTVVSSSQLSID
jgi:hypothetical protein